MSVNEVHARIGLKRIGRATIYHAIRRGELPSVRLGKRILIPRSAFAAWLSSCGIVSTRNEPSVSA
jgi:excisionase family DNA binding protein